MQEFFPFVDDLYRPNLSEVDRSPKPRSICVGAVPVPGGGNGWIDDGMPGTTDRFGLGPRDPAP